MPEFSPKTLDAVGRAREVTLTTRGRVSGKLHTVTIWVSSDGRRVFIRSGGGLSRDWPRNLLASGSGVLRVGGVDVSVRARQVTDPVEARQVTELVIRKYGSSVKRSPEGGPLSLAEQATFELLPV